MKLSQLLSVLGQPCTKDAEITSITTDSREVCPGALFAAEPGARLDGKAYIAEALERGAAAVLCKPPLPEGIPGAAVENPRAALSLVAAQFYGNPAGQLHLIGVTGTKGKTTTAHMLREILTAAGYRTGMIGTLGAWIGRDFLAPTGNTTPEPCALQKMFRQMADAGCTHCVLEVSSQAMKLHRVYGLSFDAALFLNLSPDHIGGAEHADYAEYRACKALLFRQGKLAVGNGAEEAWPYMQAEVPAGVPIRTFSLRPDIPADDMGTLSPGDGLGIQLHTGGYTYPVAMPGWFNGENALAAVSVSRALGIPEEAIRQGLQNVSVPGRTERYPVPSGCPYTVLIDYAHNGESMQALLQAIRPQVSGRIIAVFGAGGDRPVIRQIDMGKAAAARADYAILTEDNPRSERTEDICKQIGEAIGDAIPWVIIPDREQAIQDALTMAQSGDLVALLGKGHETTITQNGVSRHFSEWEVLDRWFAAHFLSESAKELHHFAISPFQNGFGVIC